jgi:hypothetical protein
MMQFASMLFNILEKCNIRCRHCGFTDLKRTKETTPEQLASWATQAVEYGVKQITFSGGEVFMDLNLLHSGVEAVHRAGGGSGVFTNSAWGKSVEDAKQILRQLPGLRFLHLSCDVYHLEWVPIEHVHHVIKAARALDIPKVLICITYADENEREMVTRLFDDYTDYVGFHYSRVITSPYVTNLIPDVEKCQSHFDPTVYTSQCFLHTPLVHVTGNVWACHIGGVEMHRDFTSSPYFLGSLKEESLKDIFERAEENPIYQYLRVGGPRAVAEAAAESADGELLGRQRFSTECDMCYQVFPRPAVREKFAEKAAGQSVQNAVFLQRLVTLGDRI